MQKSIDEIICLVVGPEFMKIISREILPYGKPSYRYGSYSTTENGHVGIVTSADSVGFNAVGQNVGNNKFCTQHWFLAPASGMCNKTATPQLLHQLQFPISNIRTNWTLTHWNAADCS